MTLKQSIQNLPNTPGIYQYFDKNGSLLYIGKAKNLSKRVKSYFSFTPHLAPKSNLSMRITKMIKNTHSLNYIVVNSEHDALILENSLIKQLNPKYNILLRDDKTFPYIFIDYSQKYPRFDITRKIIHNKNIHYFGPYSVGARDILNSIYELCKLVQKAGCVKSKKLCIYYQINKCLGPCELSITEDTYNIEVSKALELIHNKSLLIKKLEEKMLFYSDEMRFEEAAELRDRCERITKSQINSEIDFASNENYDIFAIAHNQNRAVAIKIFMRNGKIISSSHEFIQFKEEFDEDESYQRVLINYYSGEKPPIIAPILVAHNFESLQIVCGYLDNFFEKKASLLLPLRGKKKHLIDLALLNANEMLEKQLASNENKIHHEIQLLCKLEQTPHRIEIFDNSHISGEATVGAMAVYAEGNFDKANYRTYHLDAKDEYAQMRELLTKRVASFEKNPPPNLWVIDGGQTLLKLAHEIIVSHGVNLDVIAIAKEKIDAKAHRAKGKANDLLHTLDETFKLQNTDKRLQFIQNLRDEAHRCAISFHKKTKLKRDQESKLLSLKGISEAKIKKLLNHFGTFENIKTATLEDLSSILNIKDAKIIKNIYS